MSNFTAIIDYGVGNVGSVRNMLHRSGCKSKIINDPKELQDASHAILPGIGHFANGMAMLENGRWIDPVKRFALVDKKPFLGICLGMQLLTSKSEEGDTDGLDLVSGKVTYFNPEKMSVPLPVPHMGWSHVAPDRQSALFKNMDESARFYFVHSLHVELTQGNAKPIAITDYGYKFVSGLQRDNIYGVQFHPEKSHAFGSQLLRNFCDLKC